MKKIGLFLAGILTGIMYVAACGGGNEPLEVTKSLAQAVTNATDVFFNNSTSKLSATTVQVAIDEVEARVDTLETYHPKIADAIRGTWNCDNPSFGNSGSASFNEDKTAHVNNGVCIVFGSSPTSCSQLISYEVIENAFVYVNYNGYKDTNCTNLANTEPLHTIVDIVVVSNNKLIATQRGSPHVYSVLTR